MYFNILNNFLQVALINRKILSWFYVFWVFLGFNIPHRTMTNNNEVLKISFFTSDNWNNNVTKIVVPGCSVDRSATTEILV